LELLVSTLRLECADPPQVSPGLCVAHTALLFHTRLYQMSTRPISCCSFCMRPIRMPSNTQDRWSCSSCLRRPFPKCETFQSQKFWGLHYQSAKCCAPRDLCEQCCVREDATFPTLLLERIEFFCSSLNFVLESNKSVSKLPPAQYSITITG